MPDKVFQEQAEQATCSGGDVCCHISHFEEIEEECGSIDADFTCTSKSECMDDAFPDVKNSMLRFGYCSGSNDVCCKNKKPREEVDQDVCKGNGYNCRALPLCRLNAAVRKNENNPLLEVMAGDNCKSGTVNIDNSISKCEKQDEICCKGQRPSPPTINPKGAEICGRHNPLGVGLNSEFPQDGDESTQFGEWPFTCLVYGKDETLLGGASLIAPGIALTAVHKLKGRNAEDIKVRCGEWDIDRRIEAINSQERDVEAISFHPQFHKRQLYHDMALLHIDGDFDLAEHIGTICLPASPFKDDGNFAKSGCVVLGWGDRAELDPADREDSAQPIMKAVKNLPIVENDQCEQILKREVDGRFRLHDSFTCAGGERGNDACDGDGGGPLVCPVDPQRRRNGDPSEFADRYVLAGVVVGGVGCGKEIPGAYASVEHDLCFIHWATKCREGLKYEDFYNYPQCDDWLEREKPNMTRRQRAAAESLESECVPEF